MGFQRFPPGYGASRAATGAAQAVHGRVGAESWGCTIDGIPVRRYGSRPMTPGIHNYIKSVRRTLRPVKRSFLEWSTPVLRRLGLLGGEREKGLPEEVRFWELALGKAVENPDGVWFPYRSWVDPGFELQEEFKALIDAPAGAAVKLLDVGSGPLTRLGKKWEGRKLEVHAVDPLAEDYKALMARLRISAPVAPEAGDGETLLQKFPPAYFDLAHASNSLDHAYNPMLAIRQMLAVVKPNCYVYLWHFAHVGCLERYSGLHQWNFEIKGSDMILSDGRGKRYSLASEISDIAKLQCERRKFFEKGVVVNNELFGKDIVVIAKLRKLPFRTEGLPS
jgi:SAM-dependent methyltransferase